jgi:hypothetical protein
VVAFEKPALLGDRTFLSVGAAFALLVLVGGGAWWLSAMYATQGEMSRRLDRIESAILDGQKKAVSVDDMRLWIMSLKAKNPAMNTPEWVR